MQEIIKNVAKKAGISESVAEVAVQTVLSMLKNKLPDSIGGVLSSFLNDTQNTKKTTTTKKSTTTKKNDDGFGLDDIVQGLGGLLSKK
ncbi:MAG: hypothetical protein LBR51_01455 [Bacteroidales bacterium]|jgi:uncharacterized protein (DUF2267 family)|nr:hypothetical protein [Bacteroidales bacterium]